MKKEFILSFANIRKNKGHTLSLFILFLIAALLLNAGLLVSVNFGGFFQKQTEELNTSDLYLNIPTQLYSSKVDRFLKNNSTVKKMQKESSVAIKGSLQYKGDKRDGAFLLNDANVNRNLSKWKFIGNHLEPDDSVLSAYVPYLLNVDGGYRLNDKLTIKIDGNKSQCKELTFTIKGFIEDVDFSTLDGGFLGLYLPHQTLEKVRQKIGNQYDDSLVFANVSNQDNNLESGVKDIIRKETHISATELDNLVYCIGLPLIKYSRVMMAGIVSIFMVTFAILIVLVCMAVIRFRISNTIDDGMQKIGSLKAIGYTSRQIILSIVLQFTQIALVGSIVGILLSYLLTPTISKLFAQPSGLMWVQGFDGRISGIVLGVVFLVVGLVAYLSSRRIHRLEPIIALRGGIATHNFKKNYFPLHKAKGSLPLLLALKSIFQNKKSSIMIAVILIFASFAGAFSVIMLYNTTVDTTSFAETPGIERTNVMVNLDTKADGTKIINGIRGMSGVRKANFYDMMAGAIENKHTYFYVMDDFSQKETNTVFSGRYPRHDNEITISWVLADGLHKKVGDTIPVKIGDKTVDYLVTGLSQGTTMNGMTAFLTHKGMQKLNPNYKQQQIGIYLNKGTDGEQLIKSLGSRYGNSLETKENIDKIFNQEVGAYAHIMAQVSVAVLVITILVVMLVLYFVINSSIIRQKQELGIQKAIGFTTFQLMNQVTLGFLPPVAIGVILGCVLGITQMNALMSVMERTACVMKTNYIILPSWVALCGLAIFAAAYLISMLITYRIRKISAYALVSE